MILFMSSPADAFIFYHVDSPRNPLNKYTKSTKTLDLETDTKGQETQGQDAQGQDTKSQAQSPPMQQGGTKTI